MNKLYKLIENIIQTKPTMAFMNLIKKKLLLKVDKSTDISDVFKNCT